MDLAAAWTGDYSAKTLTVVSPRTRDDHFKRFTSPPRPEDSVTESRRTESQHSPVPLLLRIPVALARLFLAPLPRTAK
jgi:hypothetical protein